MRNNTPPPAAPPAIAPMFGLEGLGSAAAVPLPAAAAVWTIMMVAVLGTPFARVVVIRLCVTCVGEGLLVAGDADFGAVERVVGVVAGVVFAVAGVEFGTVVESTGTLLKAAG